MTWQDPGANPPPGGTGGPDEDATLTDLASRTWTPPSPRVRRRDGRPERRLPSHRRRRRRPAAGPRAPPAYPAFPEPGRAPPRLRARLSAATAPGMAWAPPPRPGPATAFRGAGGLEYAGAGPRFVAWFLDVILISIVAARSRFAISMLPGRRRLLELGVRRVRARGGIPEFAFDDELYGRILVAGFIGAVIATLIDLGVLRPPVVQRRPRDPRHAAPGAAGGERGGRPDAGPRTGPPALVRDGRLAGRRGRHPGAGLARWASSSGTSCSSLTTASDPRRQGLHDRFAGTAVVKEAGRSTTGSSSAVIAVLVVVACSPIISIVALILPRRAGVRDPLDRGRVRLSGPVAGRLAG